VGSIAVLVPDLLLGSNVRGWLRAAGHDAVLVPASADLSRYDLLVVDLTADGVDPAALAAAGPPTLGIFGHTQPEVRAAALDAGFTLAVPRSRMAREGGALATRLIDAAEPAGA
jgi:hypothetical protein